MAGVGQIPLFSDELSEETEASPAELWERDSAKRSLDELFSLTRQYSACTSYDGLMKFVARFRFYSPFNAMLVHVQMPGATFVAPPYRWLQDFGRRIKAAGRPLVILQPRGPVMFVFDVSDTEPTENAIPLPPEVKNPFDVRKGRIGKELETVIESAKRDGIRITNAPAGSQAAGSIRPVASDVRGVVKFCVGFDESRKPVFVDIPVRYDLVVNKNHNREVQFVTIVHELAHLYCGHLGTPDKKWWPDRNGLSLNTREFEAESVAYLVCSRANIDNPSEKYLSGYVAKEDQAPPISLECVMKAAGLIETMSRQRLKPRKPGKDGAGE